MAWTSRERVVAALEHREPDRVPIDINPVVESYLRLKAYLPIEIDEEVKPSSMREVVPHPAVLSCLGVDVTSVKLVKSSRNDRPQPRGSVRFNAWGVGLRRVPHHGGGSYLEPVVHPLAEATVDDLEDHAWPNPDRLARGEETELAAKRLYERTDLALVGRFGGPIVETAIYLVGFHRWLLLVRKDPDFAGALLDRIADITIAVDRIGLEATAPYIQIFKASGDDFGMQTGPLYAPEMVRRLFLPRLRRRWKAARSYLDRVNPSVKIMFHSCGGIRPLIPDLMDMGLDVLDPVQPLAAGMDAQELKREFGDRLTFHGGVDEQKVLPFGSEQHVEEEVRRCIRAFGPGGGYILAPSHFVQADTPPRNIVAMCRAAQRYGRYPIRC